MIGTLNKKSGIAKHLQLKNILINLIGNEYSTGQRFHSERELMRDHLHVNTTDNQIMGVDIARHFGLDLNKIILADWHDALAIQKMIDELE